MMYKLGALAMLALTASAQNNSTNSTA